MSPRARAARDTRDVAEIITLVVSIAIVAALVGGVAFVDFSSDRPPAITATVSLKDVRAEDGRHYLPLTVSNGGDQAAEAVRVVIVQRLGDRVVEHEVLIDYLAGHGRADGVAVLRDDPRGSEVTVEVRSFLTAE